MQAAYGEKWGDLERKEGAGREGIGAVCSLVSAIHLRRARGSTNEFDEALRLFKEMAGSGSGAGPAFFDQVLQPYVEVGGVALQGAEAGAGGGKAASAHSAQPCAPPPWPPMLIPLPRPHLACSST